MTWIDHADSHDVQGEQSSVWGFSINGCFHKSWSSQHISFGYRIMDLYSGNIHVNACYLWHFFIYIGIHDLNTMECYMQLHLLIWCDVFDITSLNTANKKDPAMESYLIVYVLIPPVMANCLFETYHKHTLDSVNVLDRVIVKGAASCKMLCKDNLNNCLAANLIFSHQAASFTCEMMSHRPHGSNLDNSLTYNPYGMAFVYRTGNVTFLDFKYILYIISNS